MPPITINLYVHDVPDDAVIEFNVHVFNARDDTQAQTAIDGAAGELRSTNDALDEAIKAQAKATPPA